LEQFPQLVVVVEIVR
jgi:hypothetical protein